MTDVTAALVRDLRSQTSAGMMDCKRALQESDGDMTEAKAWLRKKGLAGAQAKASRATDQGLVAVAVGGGKDENKIANTVASVVELNAETDFVARNDSFQAFLHKVALRALETQADSAETLLATSLEGESTVEEALQSLIGTIGENMRIRRCASIKVEQGRVAAYVHGRVEHKAGEGGGSAGEVSMGTIGVALALSSHAAPEALEATGKALAMHIAAAKPIVVSRAELPDAVVRQEEEILTEQARTTSAKGAPVEKIVKGRMEKFFRSVVLDEQRYALDETRSIASILAEADPVLADGDDGKGKTRVKGFVRLALGEQS